MSKSNPKIYIKKKGGQLVNVSNTILSKIVYDNWKHVSDALINKQMPLTLEMYPSELEYLNDRLKLGISQNDIDIYMDTYHPGQPLIKIKVGCEFLVNKK